MRILLTGGCGDLGKVLTPSLVQRGDQVRLLDLRPPGVGQAGEYIQGSVLEREKLKDWFNDCDVIVHIAAWHGIHEFKKEKDAYDFFDLNIRGTFEVFEAAVAAGVSRVVFISSTSVDEPNTVYGHSKIISEQTATFYAAHHNMRVVTLRPRAFIPYWNRAVYASYLDWVKWFWKGAVHIDDVAQAVERSIDFLLTEKPSQNLLLTVDGAYEYSDEDLKHWDQNGPDSTFKKHYAKYFQLAKSLGLATDQPPQKLDITQTKTTLGYSPTYSLRNVLEDLAKFGAEGPPN
jgi:nucleoside-diphosphate-sugar epimerase